MRRFFDPEAAINWHNTGEQFTAEEFIRANCAYPGRWNGRLERVETLPDRIITAVQVFSRDGRISCHVTSFMQLRQDRILTLDEYWGDDGEAPPVAAADAAGAGARPAAGADAAALGGNGKSSCGLTAKKQRLLCCGPWSAYGLPAGPGFVSAVFRRLFLCFRFIRYTLAPSFQKVGKRL